MVISDRRCLEMVPSDVYMKENYILFTFVAPFYCTSCTFYEIYSSFLRIYVLITPYSS